MSNFYFLNLKFCFSSKKTIDDGLHQWLPVDLLPLYQDDILFFSENNRLCAFNLVSKKLSCYNNEKAINDIYIDTNNDIILNSTNKILYNKLQKSD